MEKNKMKLVWFVGFIALASVSCWATAKSLHMLLPSWPEALCWVVTILFFIIASLGTKMITDSLNQNVYMEKRGLMLIGGIVIVLSFWFFCSMPTNTHTFFYRAAIADVVNADLATTKSYLQKLHDNVKTESMIKERQDKLESEVNAELIALNNEIDNIANPGFGDRAKSHLDKIATTLQVGSIPTLSYKSTSPAQLKALKEQYRTMIYGMLQQRKDEIAANIHTTQEKIYKPQAKKIISDITRMQNAVSDMEANKEMDENVIIQSDIVLKHGYGLIKNYADFIQFNSKDDENLYRSENQVTKTSKMLSVIDVWKEYFNGQYSGRGFIFWIILSILVDIAAFICFDIAFKKESI